MKKILFIFSIIASAHNLSAQAGESKADRLYNNYAFEASTEAYNSVIAKGDSQETVIRHLSNSYYRQGELMNAEPWFAMLYDQGTATKEDIHSYVQCLKAASNWPKAEQVMESFAKVFPDDTRSKKYMEQKELFTYIRKSKSNFELANLDINTAYSDFSVAFRGADVAYVSVPKKQTGIVRMHKWNNQPFLNIYFGIANSGVITNSQPLGKSINSQYHEGPVCFSQDGNTMYFTRNNFFKNKKGADSKGINRLKIYKSVYTAGKWVVSESLPFNNDLYSTGHPALSADGSTLYFVSDMPGGMGGTDIWKVNVNSDGSYGEPKNMGLLINTAGNEMFPVILPDGSLSFASNGHQGFGALDVMIAKPLKEGGFEAPFNPGPGLNSSSDDFGFSLGQDMSSGFVSSNREEGKGSDDIYSVKVLRPLEAPFLLKGVVKNSSTDEVIPGATLTLQGPDGKALSKVTAGEDGSYSVLVNKASFYTMVVDKEGLPSATADIKTSDLEGKNYVFVKDVDLKTGPVAAVKKIMGLVTDKLTGAPVQGAIVSILDSKGTPVGEYNTDAKGIFMENAGKVITGDVAGYQIKIRSIGYISRYVDLNQCMTTPENMMKIPLGQLTVGGDLGEMLGIKPIYFDKNKSDIRPDAEIELNKVLEVLKEYPTVEIELGSHTDCRSSKEYNKQLSDKRAKSSSDYIISKGIPKNRIKGVGYGESELINDCGCEGKKESTCTEEQHSLNRRTVFKIVKM
jgi:outer membrane protein OmpA-like peptidoglycan-associated protein